MQENGSLQFSSVSIVFQRGRRKAERSLSASAQKQPLSASFHNEALKDVRFDGWSSCYFPLRENFLIQSFLMELILLPLGGEGWERGVVT